VFGKGKEENCCVHRQEQPGRSSSELERIVQSDMTASEVAIGISN
jgi:hypothetical protein